MLERYLLGELPRKERRQLEKELERDDGLRAQLEELRAADRQILAAYPARAGDPRDPETSGAGPAAAGGAPPLAPGLAGGAGTGAGPVPAGHPAAAHPPAPAGAGGLHRQQRRRRPAAGPALLLYRKSGDAERILRDGDTARAGDRLQLAYIPGEQTHGVILSIDGAALVTLHFPEKADGSTALRRGRRTFLRLLLRAGPGARFRALLFHQRQAAAAHGRDPGRGRKAGRRSRPGHERAAGPARRLAGRSSLLLRK